MDDRNYDELIKKYWDGESSIEEERELKQYLRNQDDPDYEELKTMFTYFNDEKKISYKGSLKNKKTKIIKAGFIRSIAVAASVLLILTTGILYTLNSNSGHYKNITSGEIQDPAEALKITKEALAFLSVNYNKGEESIAGTIGNLEKLDIIKSN